MLKHCFSILQRDAVDSVRQIEKTFFVISRGSTFELVAALDTIKPGIIDNEILLKLKAIAEEISKMLFVMIRQLQKFEFSAK